jgi:outer membrane protein assembly factor BamB
MALSQFRWCFAWMVAAAFLSAGVAEAGDWPHWRGPQHNGATVETNLPSDLDPSRDVVWAVPMPGSSSATPVVRGDRVFVISNNATETALHALCIQRDSGEVLWNKELGANLQQPRRNTLSSCSPTAGDDRVYFMLGSGELFALDREGKELWSRNLEEEYGTISPQFGYSSSPLLLDGRLYIASLNGQWSSSKPQATYNDKDSYILCLDAASGNEIWRTHRPSDAVGESFDSYGSPIPFVTAAQSAVVMAGGDYVTGHDLVSGLELWRHRHNPLGQDRWRLIPSAVVAGDIICSAQPRGLDVFAIRPVPNMQTQYEDALWIHDGRTTDVPSPLYYKKRLFVLNGVRGILVCLDPEKGTEIWHGSLGADSRIWASPTAADDKIYFLTEGGDVIIASAGKKFDVLGGASFGGGSCKSSIAIADGKLFVRTVEKLYCLAVQG